MVGYSKIRTGLKYPRNGWSANWTRISKTKIFRVYPPSLNQSTPWSPPPVYNNNSRSQNVNKQLLRAGRTRCIFLTWIATWAAGCSEKGRDPLNQVITAAGRAPHVLQNKVTTDPSSCGSSAPVTLVWYGRTGKFIATKKLLP